MLCKHGTSHGPVSVCVCLSVTSRSSTKTAKRRITQQHHTIAQGSFLTPKISAKFDRTWKMWSYTHPFNGPLSGTTRVSRYQKGKTNLDFTEARDNEWQWYQLGHMQVCNSLQTDNHSSTPLLSFFTGWMPFLLPNQQRQSTEGVIMLPYILNGMRT